MILIDNALMRTVRVLQRRMTTAEAMPAVAAGDLVQVRQVFGTQVGVALDTLGLYDLVGIRVDGSKFRFKQRDVDLHCSGWADTASLVGEGAIAGLVKRIQEFEGKSRNLAIECKSKMARVYGLLHVKNRVCLSKIAKLLFATENPTLEQIFGAKIALQTGLYFKLMVPIVDRIEIVYAPRRSDEVRFLSDLYANKNRDQVDAFLEKCKRLISDHRNGKITRLAFSKFEQQLIKLLKQALKTPKSVSEVELLISIKLILKPLRYLLVNNTKKVVGMPEIQKLLREIGVFSTNEDMSLHLFASAGTLDNLEGLSEAGDAIVKESYYHANRLLSWSSNLNANDRLSVYIGRKGEKPKSQPRRESKSITHFFDQDPLFKLRESVSRPVFAIDSATAHEIDDAVSIEDDWLHIHIADPTSYIPHFHPLTQLARMRANSVYLTHRHYPLLPTILSDDLFNLGVTAKALTFSAKLDGQGRIVDYRVTASHLENVNRLTYDEVNTVLDWKNVIPGAPTWATGQLEKKNTTKSSKITLLDATLLSKIQQITWEHRKRRLEQNALIQDQYSNNIRLLEAPLDVSPLQVQESFQTKLFSQQTNIVINADDIPERSPSCILVQEAMIIAGRVAAKYCSERSLPVAYRGQVGPDGIAPSSLYQNALWNRHETSGVLPLKYLQPLFPYMRPAYMSRTPQAHSSLGLPGLGQNTEFPGYLKVTSPLRRFQDMVFHYQIQNSLLGIKPPFSESQVSEITVHTEDVTRRTNSLSKRSVRYWTLEYLRRIADTSGNWSQQFVGIVSISTAFTNSKVSVSIPALAGLIGPCLVSKTVENGEEILVSIEKADPFSGQVIFRATA